MEYSIYDILIKQECSTYDEVPMHAYKTDIFPIEVVSFLIKAPSLLPLE